MHSTSSQTQLDSIGDDITDFDTPAPAKPSLEQRFFSIDVVEVMSKCPDGDEGLTEQSPIIEDMSGRQDASHDALTDVLMETESSANRNTVHLDDNQIENSEQISSR